MYKYFISHSEPIDIRREAIEAVRQCLSSLIDLPVTVLKIGKRGISLNCPQQLLGFDFYLVEVTAQAAEPAPVAVTAEATARVGMAQAVD